MTHSQRPARAHFASMAIIAAVSLLCSLALHAQPPRGVMIEFPLEVQVGQVYDIHLYNLGYTGEFRLEYSTRNDEWHPIATVPAVQEASTYAWTIPFDTTSEGYLRVIHDDTVRKTSYPFVITTRLTPSMYLYRPDGSQVLYSGRTVGIIWELNNWSPEYGGVLIDYSTDAGSTWQRIDSVPYRSRVDSVAWVIPDDTTSNGVIRVFTSDSMAFARTVKLLTIRPEPSIRVLRPSGGETFLIDSLVWIVWRAESIAGHLTIEYSVDGGAYWYTIESRRDIRAGLDSLGWSVAPPLGSATIIRITHDEGELGDTTDAFATVAVLAAPEESVGDSPSLRAHPQPAAGRSATLAWLQPEHGEVWLSVASADGTIVRSESLGTYPAGGARHRLDLTGVAAGVYHVTVVGGGTTITGSIVVVR